MSGKWIFRLSVVVGVVWSAWSAVEAAAPWGNLIALKGVDATPDKAYPLSEGEGPWMIMACSFSGDGADKQAQELVYELRKRYKLPAYTFQGRFDLGEAQWLGVDKFGNPRKGTYVKYKEKYKDSEDKEKARHPEITEVAVMVGNYQSPEDPEAQKTLQKIKYAAPQCLEVKEGKDTHQDLTGWRMLQKQVYEAIGSDKKKLGPMSHAFVTTNPTLPANFFVPKNGVDDEILALNRGVPHSLLECPGKFTVRVATFKGEVIIKADQIRAIQNGKEMKGRLAEAAKKADQLTKALRKKGYEAYQFHDRYASIVTVGSFNSVGTPGADGQMEINPEIQRFVQTFTANTDAAPGVQNALRAKGLDQRAVGSAMPVQVVDGIPLDVTPVPIEVPKRSVSMAMRSR